MTDIDLDAALALCDAATAGPWEHMPPRSAEGTIHRVATPGERYPHVLMQMGDTGYSQATSWAQRAADAEFIAAARTLVPELIAELRAARLTLSVRDTDLDVERVIHNEEFAALQVRLDAVLALHSSRDFGDWPICGECAGAERWPCPTVRAATGDA